MWKAIKWGIGLTIGYAVAVALFWITMVLLFAAGVNT